MPPETSNARELVFYDRRLRMTAVGRAVVRVLSYVAYLLAVVGTAVFLFSRIEWFRWVGAFLLLFLLDRLLHVREGDRLIHELPVSG